MTIMLAGGMTVAAPGMLPEASAEIAKQANLSVSSKVFGGPMVLEVVVNDPARADTDTTEGAPDVSFDGNDLVMVQGTDGAWYAYVAEYDAVKAVNAMDNRKDGLYFGTQCIDTTDANNLIGNEEFASDAKVFVGLADCKTPSENPTKITVVREPKKLSGNSDPDKGLPYGQINVKNANVWPFIQTFADFTDGTIKVNYQATGATQTVNIEYDDEMDMRAGYSLDREEYPHGADVHLTITDAQLNIDPTDEDIWTFNAETNSDSAYYNIFDESGNYAGIDVALDGNGIITSHSDYKDALNNAFYMDNAILHINQQPNNNSTDLIVYQDNKNDKGNKVNKDDPAAFTNTKTLYVTVQETEPNSGKFSNTDSADKANLVTTTDDIRGLDFTVDYSDSTTSYIVKYFTGAVDMDETSIESDWSSGEPITVNITDQDNNKNTLSDDDFTIKSDFVPALKIGDPGTLAGATENSNKLTSSISDFSDIMKLEAIQAVNANEIITIQTQIDSSVLNLHNDKDRVYVLIHYHGLNDISNTIAVEGATKGKIVLPSGDLFKYIPSSNDADKVFDGNLKIVLDTKPLAKDTTHHLVFDIFVFGQDDSARYNEAIYRLLAEETTTNSGVYTGTIEYVMLNQINIYDEKTFTDLAIIDDELGIIVHEDLTEEDGVEVIYYDKDAQGETTLVSDKVDAPTHSGVVSFDAQNYKIADTVTVTLTDHDLNTDSDVRDVYTAVVSDADTVKDGIGDTIGKAGNLKSELLSVTFDDQKWRQCTSDGETISGFTGNVGALRESTTDSGIFELNFQVPSNYCTFKENPNVENGQLVVDQPSVTGKDIEVKYMDFRDASGEEIETSDSAGIRANTGSVSFDRTVYPVPFGKAISQKDSSGKELNESYFQIHDTSSNNNNVHEPGRHLPNGDLMVHIRVNDPDFDTAGSGQDKIAVKNKFGPVKVMVSRGSNDVVLATAGAAKPSVGGKITIGEDVLPKTKELGPITETKPDSGIFELDMTIKYTDGPKDTSCPKSEDDTERIHTAVSEDKYCILQGDILTVEYTDPTDASGNPNTVTDSATFDLRNGVLQTDKSVYIIGSDMIVTLIEPDFDLDNDSTETYLLDLIEWDSDAKTTTLGKFGDQKTFDPEPSALKETGDSTGIFQVVLTVPAELGNKALDRGEEITLEYTDNGPAGAKYVGDENEDINVTVYTSNFGATIELDQNVYSWTDKVYITIVAPDHNFDSDLVDSIGNTDKDPLKVSTKQDKLENYKLVETGTDTGIFTGEVILTGFGAHDANGDGSPDDASGKVDNDNEGGPTDGKLPAEDDDGITVSYEFSEDETVIKSALIRWNIGEVQWLEASYPASGTGVVRVIDPDMNLNPEAVDNFKISVTSDSDSSGIDLSVTETNEATGIFEGTVVFTVTEGTSGTRLRVAESDTVTAEYEDHTLPKPNSRSQELDVTATTLIGTSVPPLERAPAVNLRTVDGFGNSIDTVSVDVQVQVTADLSNGQERDQEFAYLVQIQDDNGVTVHLAWITGKLTSGQSLSPALSWLPTAAGTYTATAFVWESLSTPTALSPPASTTITVS